MSAAVFLDRDGVINSAVVKDGRPYPPASVGDVHIPDDVPRALDLLKAAGFRLAVITNQPDVARGTQRREVVESINASLAARLPLERFEVCYHDNVDRCDCRKPQPGLIRRAGEALGVDVSSSFVVGDRWQDIEAAKAAGCRSVWIDRAYAEKQPSEYDYRASSLFDAALWIIKNMHRKPEVKRIEELNVKIFADGADKAGMLEMYAKPYIQGLTTNPTLMRKAGIADYRAFSKEILAEIKTKPISFEVFSDDFEEMERQAEEIASWGDNVYVKIPVTNSKREVCYPLLSRLAGKRIKLNVTAIMTLAQVRDVVASLDPTVASYVSVFAGRIADTGVDPVPLMAAAVALIGTNPKSELIWASPRELLNIFQADAIGCQVITVTSDILKKLALVGYDLDRYSLDTVKMFHDDALSAGYRL